jgi:hypothetical protein
MGKLEKKSIKEFLTNNVRQFKVRQGTSTQLQRYDDEILIIRTGTEEYMLGQRQMPCRLQDVKDVLVNQALTTKTNPYNMDLDGGANAKIQKDSKKITKKVLLYDGKVINICGKELNDNAVILFDIDYACAMINEEKDSKKKTLMTERKDKIIKLPNRAGYGVNSP